MKFSSLKFEIFPYFELWLLNILFFHNSWGHESFMMEPWSISCSKILQSQYVKFHQASALTICMLIICLITTKKKPTWMIIEILLIRTVSSSVQLRIKISKLIWKPTKAYKYECGSSEQEK